MSFDDSQSMSFCGAILLLILLGAPPNSEASPCEVLVPVNTVSKTTAFNWVMTFGTKNWAPSASSWICGSNQTADFDGVGDFAIDVTKNGLSGDGVTDNTEALNTLLNASVPTSPTYGAPLPLYFPPGVYRFTGSITWPSSPPSDPNWAEGPPAGGCCVSLRGAGVDETTLYLADNSAGFTDASNPKSFIVTKRGNRSFRQYLRDFSVVIGKGNAGARAVDYIASNRGAMRNLRIVALGSAAVGVEMTRSWPGPAMLKRIRIEGFQVGISIGQPEYGMTLEYITLVNQTAVAINNSGNQLHMRKIVSQQTSARALQQTSNSMAVLLDSQLSATAAPGNLEAIASQGALFLRNVSVSGYAVALVGSDASYSTLQSEVLTPTSLMTRLFTPPAGQGTATSLNLPILETPEPFWSTNISDWWGLAKNPNWCFGSTGRLFQQALASNRSCLYMSTGQQRIQGDSPAGDGTYVIPRNVRLIASADSPVNNYSPVPPRVNLYIAGDASDPPLVFDNIYFDGNIHVYHNSTRTLAFLHSRMPAYHSFPGSGNLFIEDCEPGSGRVNASEDPLGVGAAMIFDNAQNVFMRQFNPETIDRYKIINRAANLWILGLKTENVGTIIRTEGSGRTELLGGYIYSVRKQNDIYEAAFETVNATSSLYWMYANTGSGSYFPFLFNETQGAIMRSVVNTNPSGNFVLSKQASISFGPNWQTGPSGLCSNCDWLGGSAPPVGTCQYDFLSDPDPSYAQPGASTLAPTSGSMPTIATVSVTAGAGTSGGAITSRSSTSSTKGGLSAGAIAGVVVGVVIVSAVVAALAVMLLRRRNQKSSRHSSGGVRDYPVADM